MNKKYWVSLLILDDFNKPVCFPMGTCNSSLKESLGVIERSRKNFTVLSAWVYTYDGKGNKTTEFHDCYVDFSGKIERF